VDFNSVGGRSALTNVTNTLRGEVVDAFFEQYYRSHPVNATFTGLHASDAQLPDWSVGARALEAEALQAMLNRFPPAELDNAETLRELNSDGTALDMVLAEANVRMRLLEHSGDHFHRRNPALFTGEAIFGVASLMIRDFAPAATRAVAMTARFNQVPAFLQAMRTDMTGDVPEQWRDRAERECRAATELFGDGLEMWMDEHLRAPSPSEAGAGDVAVALRSAAKRACEAFAATRAWLKQCSVADVGAYCIGAKAYDGILRLGHFCEEGADVLLQRAWSALHIERARLQAMLDARANSANEADVDLMRRWADVQLELAADRPTTATYYESFTRRWQEIHTEVLKADVVSWPDSPITFVPIPAWARRAAPQLYWLFYRSPAPFDRYETYHYLVTPIDETFNADEQTKRLSVWNHSTITLNHVVHHGGVGHHLQNWNAVHRSQSRVGTVAAVDCASRIGMFLGGSMAEGWACYATELVEELGLLTPLEILAQQHTRVRQLARAVADINLHTNAFTFAECAQFYVQQTGMSLDAANAETTKNSMFPGTAIMYWLGTQGILDLRNAMQERVGAQFQLRAFHDELLSRGSIPVLLAAKLMLAE
jgi:uncharacterized protein (DUF885 family)